MANNCVEGMPCPATQRVPLSQFSTVERHAAIARKKQQELDDLAAYERVREVRTLGPHVPYPTCLTPPYLHQHPHSPPPPTPRLLYTHLSPVLLDPW